MKSIVFFDTEIGIENHTILDIGAVRDDGSVFHSASVGNFRAFAAGCEYVCGHNIVNHDLKYLLPFGAIPNAALPIDTLFLSPLLFPKRPYHALLKDDKIQSDELNNPVNDSKKAQDLFNDEVNAFARLPETRQRIFYALLGRREEFRGFFQYIGFAHPPPDLPALIRAEFAGKICAHAEIAPLMLDHPVELAYALALIGADDHHSVTPPWLLRTSPGIVNVLKVLRNTPCKLGCAYCRSFLDIHKALREIFGHPGFLTPLQEQAVQAAVDGKSLLALFPTGGGKSLTFQLPALMAGRAARGLTVVISPLQSLMKDQVDNLKDQFNIVEAVTVNGLLSPIERKEAYDRVESGLASLLYISPELIRSRTLEKLLLARNIARFVIDEAHCFSAWGHDFRVDYLFIGDFIRQLQEKKSGGSSPQSIPVSCFTATAKQKVISDICDYFKQTLNLNLERFTSGAERENLHYYVLHQETEEAKYATLRGLIERKQRPTIVYVSRTKRARELAEKLTKDGLSAKPYHGKMDPAEKILIQEAFKHNEILAIVATSAFGMGVDKKDVGLVIHYDISDSLENYIQEAGRAGRDPDMRADCYVLYHDGDLDEHFSLLSQTKLSISNINQVWRAVKNLTRHRSTVYCSALELAREAGWSDALSPGELETRVRSAVAALENAGYVRRGRNVPRVYATSIMVRSANEAISRIKQSPLFPDGKQREAAGRIIASLVSCRSIAKAGNDDAESRIDYLADRLGLEKREVLEAVNLMRQEGLLADDADISAWILKQDAENKSLAILRRFAGLEQFVLTRLREDGGELDLKQCVEAARTEAIAGATIRNIRTILYYSTIRGALLKEEKKDMTLAQVVRVTPQMPLRQLREKCRNRIALCEFVIQDLFEKRQEYLPQPHGETKETKVDEIPVLFSLVELLKAWREAPKPLYWNGPEATLADVEDALLYLSKIEALKLEGGFLVLYNSMEIVRRILDNRRQYTKGDYRRLDAYYKLKIQQIHIVGEFANLMVKSYEAALQFVRDYFRMDFREFINTYFKGRETEIGRNISPEKYRRIFGTLSGIQKRIIDDADSRHIVVAAGPGSGKTRVLAHKLAALLLLEDVKHEQLLMVTFSRSAATEFKKRLLALVGNAANFVEIKTFHSYCFDLLGRPGSLQGVDSVIQEATHMIEAGEVEPGKITKTVLVIDEAQDMDAHEFALVQALMKANEALRVIAVGDDDQNIYAFRGSDSKYLRALIDEHGAAQYEMVENYRSGAAIVALANRFVTRIRNRMKSRPLQGMRPEQGQVRLVRHTGAHMEEAIVNEIVANPSSGSVCVLTATNDDALRLVGLLLKRGVDARLVQSNEGFRLYNLAEVRYFLKQIDQGPRTPVIDDALWEEAKTRLAKRCEGSACLENCNNMIADFAATNSTKYRTDLEEFIKESNYDDFYGDARGLVTVSTIHKAKGREFDTVYMHLNRVAPRNDEELRTLYVGMTRARDALVIHCNNRLFDGCEGEGIEVSEDRTEYSEPDELALRLTHRDVDLGYFRGKKNLIFRVLSGTALEVSAPCLRAQLDGRPVPVAKLSKAFVEKLEQLRRMGYAPYAAEARFVVAWRSEEMQEETAVLLPNLYLRKQRETRQPPPF